MKTGYFRIIMPNYNNSEWLDKSIPSVLNQTFKDFVLIIIDDASTDGADKKILDYSVKDNRIYTYLSQDKHWNGGSRNIGLNVPNDESTYTIFIDSDDWFSDENCLQHIYDIIQENNQPDCIRLSYNCVIGEDSFPQIMEHDTPEKLVNALEVACWTKCIKSELIEKFPENTLMEDVVQHIKQCDKLDTVVLCTKPIICWNRNNNNSCSKEENQTLQKGKWQSSMYRYAADLMDTVCIHDYCEAHRQWRLGVVLENIKQGKYIQ